jgi:hypothetical protein
MLAIAMAACRREQPPPPEVIPTHARLVRFEVSSTAVEAGDRVTISWQTEQAVKNTITTADGALVIDTRDQAGFVETSPISAATTFVIRARGEDEQIVEAMTSVAIIEQPSEVAILQFQANALTIVRGESTELRWEAVNAASLRINAGRIPIYETTTDFSATLTVHPDTTTIYTLNAYGTGGPKTQQVTITVDDAPPPPPRPEGACGDDPRGALVGWFEEVPDALPREIIPPGTAFFGSGGGLADLDRDGLLDLVIASRGAPVVILKNLGDFRFEEVDMRAGITSRSPSAGVALGDLDDDGDMDLLLLGIQQTLLYENLGDGTFQRFVSSSIEPLQPAESALLVDLDSDGRLEILLNIFGRDIGGGDDERRNDRLLKSTSGLDFTDITVDADLVDVGQSWVSSVFDANLDGALDLYIANDTFSQDYGEGMRFDTALAVDHLFLNNRRADLRFTNATRSYGLQLPHSSMGSVIGDFNLDGILDIYISNLGKNQLYLGQSNSAFVESSEELGVAGTRRNNDTCADLDPDCLLVSWGALFEDFDNDGNAELLVLNGALAAMREQPSLLFVRTPGSDPVRYEERDPGLGCIDGRALLPADLDEDGDLDLVVITRNAPVRVYRNHSPAEHGSLRVQLEGRSSNREGVGAFLTLELDDQTTQVRTIGAGGMIHSTLPREAHFGLGTRQAAALTVRWPSGQVQTIAPVPAERLLKIVEPN